MSVTSLAFVLAYLTCLAMAIIGGSHWAFYLYELVYFFNPESRWWSSALPSLPYSRISVVLLLATFVLSMARRNKTNELLKLPMTKWFIFLLLAFWISYYFAINPEKHYRFSLEFVKMVITIAIAYKILDTPNKLEYALFAYMIGCAYIGWEAMLVGRNSFGRVEGIGMVDAPEANGIAASLVASIPLFIFYFWRGSVRIRVACVVLGALTVNGLVMINSRGAFVGMMIGGGYFMFEMFRNRLKRRNQKAVAITLTLIGCIALLSVIDTSFIERMYTLTEIEDESKSGSNRYRLWIIALQMSFEYPFGTGVFGFQILSPQYVPAELFINNQKQKAVHSIWMQSLSEVGWIGFIAFLMILLNAFLMIRKARGICAANGDDYHFNLGNALLAALLGTLATSSFIDQFRVQIVYWVVLFIACFHAVFMRLYLHAHEERSQEEQALGGAGASLSAKPTARSVFVPQSQPPSRNRP